MLEVSQNLTARSALGTARDHQPQMILDTDQLRIVEETFLSIISLRKSRRQLDNSAVNNWLRALGLKLPQVANGLAGDAQLGCCWLEPNAWLVVSTMLAVSRANETGLLATTISDRLIAFRLSGPMAAQVIAAGCDADIVKTGACARTRFAEFATVLIQRWGDNDYRLLLDVSIARSFAGWLLDAGRNLK